MPAVLYEKKGNIAYITLNRPEAMNSISQEVWAGLTKAWQDVRDDPQVWVAIVTGAGEKAFCAGADLKESSEAIMKAMQAGKPLPIAVPEVQPMRGIEVWKPFIAAINGLALGGGLELALACDIRIAAEKAVLGLPEVSLAIMPGAGGTQRLPRLVPLALALEILMSGQPITAPEAYRIGLVNKVVPPQELMPTAEALAKRICANGPLAVQAVKEAAYRGLRLTLDEGLTLERQFMDRLLKSEDAMEGPRAFAEKRKPVFKGK